MIETLVSVRGSSRDLVGKLEKSVMAFLFRPVDTKVSDANYKSNWRLLRSNSSVLRQTRGDAERSVCEFFIA